MVSFSVRNPDGEASDLEKLRSNYERRSLLLHELGELSDAEREILRAYVNAPTGERARVTDSDATLERELIRVKRRESYRRIILIPAGFAMLTAVVTSLTGVAKASVAHLNAETYISAIAFILAAVSAVLSGYIWRRVRVTHPERG